MFNYTARGFVPAMIRPEPTEDLSAITFLGEQIATQHPVVQGWSAGSPARIDYDVAASSARGPTDRTRAQARIDVSDRRGLQGLRSALGRARAIQRSDRLQHRSASPRATVPTASCRRRSAARGGRASSTSSGTPARTGTPATSTTCSVRPSAAARGTTPSWPTTGPIIYRPPETLRREREASPTTATSTRCPTSRTCRRRRTSSSRARSGSTTRNVRSSIGERRRRDRLHLGRARARLRRRRRRGARARGTVRRRLRAAARAHLDLAAQRGSADRRATATTRSRTSSSAASATTTSTTATPSATARCSACPGSRSTRSAAARSPSRCSSCNLPPLRFEALGTPGFYVPWARSALFASALSTNFEDGDVRETVYNVGVQIDFQLHVMHRLPMMLSFGYAHGFADGGRGRRRVHDLAQGPLMGAPRGPRSAQ